MKVLEKRFDYTRPQQFRIYPLGDIHAGSVDCAERAVREQRDIIKKDRDGYWIGMGDIIDAITESDKRWDTKGIASWVKHDNIIESQRKFAVELLKPIAHKCIAYLSGNHEEAVHSNHNNDISLNICEDLGLPYAGYSCFIELFFTRSTESHKYTIHAWHGAGSAQTEGAQLMRLKRLVKENEADVYLMGHLHTIVHDITDRLSVRGHKIKSVPRIATITGSWKKSYNEESIPWEETKGFRPAHIGCPIIIFEPDKDKIIYQSGT